MGYGARSRQVNFPKKLSDSIVDDQELDEDQSGDPNDDHETDQVEDKDVDCWWVGKCGKTGCTMGQLLQRKKVENDF